MSEVGSFIIVQQIGQHSVPLFNLARLKEGGGQGGGEGACLLRGGPALTLYCLFVLLQGLVFCSVLFYPGLGSGN